MTRVRRGVIFVFSLFAIQTILAQPHAKAQNSDDHAISVHREGVVFAKPDMAILIMSIRSSGAISEEAVAETKRKATAVEAALAGLGYGPQGYKLASVVFGQAGGPIYNPNQSAITTYEATQAVYVFFEAADLSDAAKLTEKTAVVIEALRKAGAVPNAPNPRMPQAPGGMMIYTVKDSGPYESQALQQAVARAREAAQDIAKGLGVQITGVHNVKSMYISGEDGTRQGQISLEGLPYRFYSTKSEVVQVTERATVDFDFK